MTKELKQLEFKPTDRELGKNIGFGRIRRI